MAADPPGPGAAADPPSPEAAADPPGPGAAADPPGPGAADVGAPAPRNRYADLLRVLAIGMVVLGHWLLTSISYAGGQLSGASAMADIGWSGWGTLLFQVMPVFFLVGGYANAVSWTRHRADGATWASWVRHRAIRLLRPTTVFVAAAVIAVAASRLAGADPAEVALAGWGIAIQLWFLPVYLLLIALTPALHAAHRRWGLAVPAVAALAAAGVDAGLLGAGLTGLGYANYLLVWGSIHQWGFAWQDGTLTRRGPGRWRWRPWALAAAGAVTLSCLLAWSPFDVDMVGTTGGRANNTIPPSVALLAFAAAQAGLLLAAEPAMSRLLARGRLWAAVSWLNGRVLTVYLWHMVPVVVVAVALYPTGVLGQPPVGSGGWWALRLAWIAALAVVLAPAAIFLARFERPLRRPGAPARSPAGLARSGLAPSLLASAVLALGVAAAGVALTRIAVSGFAPDGSVPVTTIAGYAGGVALTLLAGRLAPGAPIWSRGLINDKLSVGSSIRRGRRDRLAGLRSRF
jgi:peptidoglycan/LPS O-acetylase OafA/YrhL